MSRPVWIPAAAALWLSPAVTAVAAQMGGPVEGSAGGIGVGLVRHTGVRGFDESAPSADAPAAISADTTSCGRTPVIPSIFPPWGEEVSALIDPIGPRRHETAARSERGPGPSGWRMPARLRIGAVPPASRVGVDDEMVGVLFPNDRTLGARGLARFIPAPGPATGGLAGAALLGARRRRRANDSACRRSP